MPKKWLIRILLSAAVLAAFMVAPVRGGDYRTSVRGNQILLNGTPDKIIGLRCSNALISDATAQMLIAHLDVFKACGVNTVSVYFMGSRFGDVKGYRADGSLDPVYAVRMQRIIEAADRRGMMVLVGCLYWSTSRAKEELDPVWKQADANRAVANTVQWLREHDLRNVIVDPDNEGMASKAKKWSIAEMIDAGHAADRRCVIGNNCSGPIPANADVLMHHSAKDGKRPWFESEGEAPNASGGYWGTFSKEEGHYNYIRIGRYTDAMKAAQIEEMRKVIAQHNGYMLASTWLQCGAGEGIGGPFMTAGGRADNPSVNEAVKVLQGEAGIRWWLDFVKAQYGPWDPPPPARGADESEGRRLDAAFAILKKAIGEDEIPGAAALVARRGKIVREEALGFRNVENRIPFTTDTICWIASITKPVTTAAAMKLVETGKLGLDDPVEKYLPEFRRQTDKQGRHHPFTIRQIMSHTTGLPENPPNRDDVFTPKWRGQTLAETIAPMAEATLLFAPGTKVQYSNTAFYVLGRIIELVAGKPYADYVKETILDPLGMKESYFPRSLAAAEAGRIAPVYRVRKGSRFLFFRYEPGMMFRNDTPDGGLFCTMHDLLKFFQMFLDNDGRVLARESVEAMLREQAPGRGLGWSLEHGGFAHGGSSGAFAWGDPDTGVVGILFLQCNDFRRTPLVQSAFVEAVRASCGDLRGSATTDGTASPLK